MAKQKDLIARLQMKVRILQKREELAKEKLRSVIKKMHQTSRIYKRKLASNMRVMKNKIANAQTSTYAKVAADLERKLLKSIEAKSRAFASAVASIEKKHAATITRSVAKKAKKSKVSKTDKTRKSSPQ